MAVTYSDSLSSARDRLRFAIGDTTASAGPKPADGNFTDAELDGLLAIEGTWQRAVAAVFETLASLWARHTTFNADGMSVNQSDVAQQYRDMARAWRLSYGSASGSSGTVAVTRADGYSDDLDNMETEDVL